MGIFSSGDTSKNVYSAAAAKAARKGREKAAKAARRGGNAIQAEKGGKR